MTKDTFESPVLSSTLNWIANYQERKGLDWGRTLEFLMGIGGLLGTYWLCFELPYQHLDNPVTSGTLVWWQWLIAIVNFPFWAMITYSAALKTRQKVTQVSCSKSGVRIHGWRSEHLFKNYSNLIEHFDWSVVTITAGTNHDADTIKALPALIIEIDGTSSFGNRIEIAEAAEQNAAEFAKVSMQFKSHHATETTAK